MITIYPDDPVEVSINIDNPEIRKNVTLKSVDVFKDDTHIKTLDALQKDDIWFAPLVMTASHDEGTYRVVWSLSMGGEITTSSEPFLFKKTVKSTMSMQSVSKPFTNSSVETKTSNSLMQEHRTSLRYFRDRPILLYSNFNPIDLPVVPSIQEVRAVVLRPNGDRYATLNAELKEVGDFGKWYTVVLNLGFTDEPGEWLVKWIYKTDHGEWTSEHGLFISIAEPVIQHVVFQALPEEDDTLPDELKALLDG